MIDNLVIEEDIIHHKDIFSITWYQMEAPNLSELTPY